jgi:hypothetical protein
MSDDTLLSLRYLRAQEKFVPGLAGFPSRLLVETYDDFIKILYRDIDNVIYQIQENPELRQSDTEDRLTIEIVNNLRCMGYDAAHDSKIGGHADLVIKKGNFIWIGEAKIHHDYNYLWEGFQQLATRYSTGDSNQSAGGLLIYIRVEDTNQVIQKWQEFLKNKELSDYSIWPCEIKSTNFFSSHKHEKSGFGFTVRHMPIMLYFKPKDKSGRKSRASR